MRKAIFEYIELTDAEKKELWETATFVFDTNVLLNLYRYTAKTREQLLQAIEELKDRIWIPHHVAEEFMKDRYKVISDSCNAYQSLIHAKEQLVNQFSGILKLNKKDSEIKELEMIIDQWIEKFENQNPRIQDYLKDDVLEKILTIFDGKVGDGFDSTKISELEKEGKERYEKQIPPGYKDYNKQKSGSNNIFGDLLIWKEILKYAADEKKDIIYITNDQKEDWWNICGEKTIGPRVELRQEFYQATSNRQFHMYKMETFLSIYISNKGENVDNAIIEEIGAVSSEVKDKYINDVMEERYIGSNADIESQEKILSEKVMLLQRKNESRIRSLRKFENQMRHGLILPEGIRAQMINTQRNIDNTNREIERIERELMFLQYQLR